jgi:hypothetical protein
MSLASTAHMHVSTPRALLALCALVDTRGDGRCEPHALLRGRHLRCHPGRVSSLAAALSARPPLQQPRRNCIVVSQDFGDIAPTRTWHTRHPVRRSTVCGPRRTRPNCAGQHESNCGEASPLILCNAKPPKNTVHCARMQPLRIPRGITSSSSPLP